MSAFFISLFFFSLSDKLFVRAEKNFSICSLQTDVQFHFFPEGIPPGVLNPLALIWTGFSSAIQHSWHPRAPFCHHPRNILCLSYFLDPISSSFLIHSLVFNGAHPLVAFWDICKDLAIWKYLIWTTLHSLSYLVLWDASNFIPIAVRGSSRILTSRLKIS